MLREDEAITMLVNNAGIGAVTPLLNTNVGQVDNLIALNVAALTRLTYAAAPAFVARARGTIINVASIVGISPETLNGVYGATKAYVLALTHSLQHELAAKGSASRPFCRVRRRPTSGTRRGFLIRTCPHRSSCRQKTWWMQRWWDSTGANA